MRYINIYLLLFIIIIIILFSLSSAWKLIISFRRFSMISLHLPFVVEQYLDGCPEAEAVLLC